MTGTVLLITVLTALWIAAFYIAFTFTVGKHPYGKWWLYEDKPLTIIYFASIALTIGLPIIMFMLNTK